MTKITVLYESIDRFRKKRTFKTLEGARKFATHYVGEDADIGSFYAVSCDGVGKITVDGCTLRELFTGKADLEPNATLPYEVWFWHVYEEGDYPSKKIKDSAFATLHEANQQAEEIERYSDGVHLVGTTPEAQAAITAQNEAAYADAVRDFDDSWWVERAKR